MCPPSAVRCSTPLSTRPAPRDVVVVGSPIVTLAIIFTGLFWMSISLDKIANPRLKGSTRG